MIDKDGYPTNELLDMIKEWNPTDFEGLANLLISVWRWKDYCRLEDGILYISTGGWSGHEEIMDEIPLIWKSMFFVNKSRGGHYIFSNKNIEVDVSVTRVDNGQD